MGLPQRKQEPEPPPPLSPEEAEELHREVREWTLMDDLLVREFRFDDFEEAMDFVNDVAAIARDADHHPDLHIAYNKVRVELTTHKLKGLSPKDFEVAAQIDQLI